MECCLHPVNKSQIENIYLYVNITLDLNKINYCSVLASHAIQWDLPNPTFCVRKDRVSTDSKVQVKTLKMVKWEWK